MQGDAEETMMCISMACLHGEVGGVDLASVGWSGSWLSASPFFSTRQRAMVLRKID